MGKYKIHRCLTGKYKIHHCLMGKYKIHHCLMGKYKIHHCLMGKYKIHHCRLDKYKIHHCQLDKYKTHRTSKLFVSTGKYCLQLKTSNINLIQIQMLRFFLHFYSYSLVLPISWCEKKLAVICKCLCTTSQTIIYTYCIYMYILTNEPTKHQLQNQQRTAYFPYAFI